RIHVVAEMLAAGERADQVVLAVANELKSLLDLRYCRFDPAFAGQPGPFIERHGAITWGSVEWGFTTMGLPRKEVTLVVEHQGRPLARYVLLARTDYPVTVGQLLVAVAAAGEAGPLRICVTCAGLGIATRTVARDGTPHDLDPFRFVLNVNLIGTFNVLRLAASAMSGNEPVEDGERGVIVNTASVAAFDGQIGQIAYSASKGGIVSMTLTAARDLAAAGIRVVTVAPGTFDTPLMGFASPETKEGLAANIPF